MSAQWARLTAKATIEPSTNTGRIALTSGRWLPPISGRLRNHTSPGASRDFGTRLRNSLTVKLITPMCMGMSRPCAMRWPSASVSADDRSPASRRSGDRAERITTRDISSAVALRALRMTSRVTGSTAAVTRSLRCRCRRWPASSAVRVAPGGTTTVDHASSTTRGPASIRPAVSPARAARGVAVGPCASNVQGSAVPGIGCSVGPEGIGRCSPFVRGAETRRRIDTSSQGSSVANPYSARWRSRKSRFRRSGSSSGASAISMA